MSWSINLSGPQRVVAQELAEALLLLDKALDWVQLSDKDIVSANLSGPASSS